MIESVIIGAKRSPIGIKNGKMLGIRPDDLASQVVRGLLEKVKVCLLYTSPSPRD